MCEPMRDDNERGGAHPHGEVHKVHHPTADLDAHREEDHLGELLVSFEEGLEASEEERRSAYKHNKGSRVRDATGPWRGSGAAEDLLQGPCLGRQSRGPSGRVVTGGSRG